MNSSYQDDKLITDRTTFITAVVGLYLIALGFVAISDLLPPIISTPPIVIAFSIIPGVMLLSILVDYRNIGAKFWAISFGLSLMSMMILGFIINVTFPAVGINRPLDVTPVAITVSIFVSMLVIGVRRLRPNEEIQIFLPNPIKPTPLAFAILPLASIIGMELINRSFSNIPLVLLLLFIAFVPLIVFFWIDEKWHSFSIWSMAMAVLYHEAVVLGKSFPGNDVVIRIARAGRWEPGTLEGGSLSTELLQHGTIFPMYSHLNGIEIMTQMTLVNPFFVSFIPLLLFLTFRRYVTSRQAFLAASVFVFAHPFYIQYPTAGRAATPVLFLSLFALTFSNPELSTTQQTTFAMIFSGGVVLTHYGTSYFFLAALSGAITVLIGIRLMDYILERTGHHSTNRISTLRQVIKIPGVISWPLFGFYAVLTESWFLLTNNSRAFALFPRHGLRIAQQFLQAQAAVGAGRTGARLQRDYGSQAIELSKQIYIILGILMVLGLTITILRRLRNTDEYDFDDGFVAVAAAMLALFLLTIVVRTWGGGRPMMISFVFTTVFAVVGMEIIGSNVTKFIQNILFINQENRLDSNQILSVFAIIIAGLFLLNSGVVVALGLFDEAPSNNPTIEAESVTDGELDIATHTWLIDHHAGPNVYGDRVAFGHTDWAAPEIAANTENGTNYGGERPRNELEPLYSPGAGSGYILLLSHNVENGVFIRTHTERHEVESVRTEYLRNIIYTTGKTRIYYFNESY